MTAPENLRGKMSAPPGAAPQRRLRAGQPARFRRCGAPPALPAASRRRKWLRL